jgi:hypothetical protein
VSRRAPPEEPPDEDLPLFPEPGRDREKSDRARDEAVDRVWDHAEDGVRHAVMAAISKAARMHPELTSEHVRHVYVGPVPHEWRVIGPAMRTAQRAGLVEPTNRHEIVGVARNHSRPQRIWRSLVFRPL